MAAEPRPVVDAVLAPPTGESSVEWVRLAAGEKAGEDVPAGAQTTKNEHKFLGNAMTVLNALSPLGPSLPTR